MNSKPSDQYGKYPKVLFFHSLNTGKEDAVLDVGIMSWSARKVHADTDEL
jgi:hypothetical protein